MIRREVSEKRTEEIDLIIQDDDIERNIQANVKNTIELIEKVIAI